MTYRAPVPVGPEDERWPEHLASKRAFSDAVTALTDSALGLEHAVDLVESIDIETLLGGFKERRNEAKQKLIDIGLTNGFRADDVDPSKTEALRRTWMTLKGKTHDDSGVMATLIEGEHDAKERLEGSRNRGLPPAIENVLGSAIVEISDNLELLDTEELNKS